MRPQTQLFQQPPPFLRHVFSGTRALQHPPILETRHWRWPDEAGCEADAAALALHPGIADAYIELHGELGAGKTTFVRHLLRALGVEGRIKSPTFAVLEPYAVAAVASVSELVISHFDFYRFNDAREWVDAGFRDVFAAPGLKLAEWPEHAAALLPAPDLRLTIEVDTDDSRTVRVEACTARGLELLA